MRLSIRTALTFSNNFMWLFYFRTFYLSFLSLSLILILKIWVFLKYLVESIGVLFSWNLSFPCKGSFITEDCVWNPSICVSECDRDCDISEYLKDFTFTKGLVDDLQPRKKYLRKTLVFMRNSTLWEKFNFCFQEVFG